MAEEEHQEDPRIDDGSLFPVYNAEPFKPESILPTLEDILERVWLELTAGKRKLPEQLEVGPADEEDWIEIDTDQITSKDLNPGMSGILTWAVEMLWQTEERFKDKKIAETGDPKTSGIKTKRFTCGCIIHTGLGPFWDSVMITKSDRESLSKKREKALDSNDKAFMSKFHKKPVPLIDGFKEATSGTFRIGYLSGFDKNRMTDIQYMYGWNLSSVANLAIIWGIACSIKLFQWHTVKEARVAILAFIKWYEDNYGK